MNENERKFFLRRFFSFNVPTNVATGSNNASFDDADEIDLKLDETKETRKSHEFSYLIDSKRPESLTKSSPKSSKKSGLEDIRELSLNTESLENEKLIKEKDKKIDFGTISRRNKFKKSTDSSKHLIAASSSNIAGTNSDYDLNLIGQISQPIISISDCKETDITETNNERANTTDNTFLGNTRLDVNAKRGMLQEQYSIELKPFKKKEVHIETENNTVRVENSSNEKPKLELSPLLALSLNAGSVGSKSLIDNLPSVPSIDMKNVTNAGHIFYNYPSVEFPTQPVPVSNIIKYRNLGKSGLRVSQFGLGTWVTFGSQISDEVAEDIITLAYQSGINLFDTAEVYAAGKAEITLGKILKKKNWRRSSYIVTTKLYWGGRAETEKGLSRKHIIEGVKGSLERLQLDYVDIVFANKPDTHTPMEEIVRSFTHLINNDMAFYWGTSRWNSMEIMEAYSIARQFNLIPPVCEQAEYHLFQRDEVEIHLPDIYRRIGLGTMTWSPLACGLLTGKYEDGIPMSSRASLKGYTWMKDKILNEDGRKKQDKIRELQNLAEKLNCTVAQLSIAWCVKNDSVNCVLLGASTVEQLYENLQSLQVVPKLTYLVLNEIERILGNKPISRAPSLAGKSEKS